MKRQTQGFAPVGVLLATLFTTLIAHPCQGLEARPATITWNTINELSNIVLTDGGMPVPASNVTLVQFVASGHDYAHMIAWERVDGKLRVRPTAQLELGTYDLMISTGMGATTVRVNALLPIVDISLAARAERQGVSVADVKRQLGISQHIGLEEIELNLPDAYYKGQSLTLEIARAAGRDAELLVNGEPVVAENGVFRYVFMETGIHDVSYAEKQDGRTVALGLDTVVVALEPRIPIEVDAGTQLTLQGPADYEEYTWRVDEQVAGTGKTWTGVFETPGEHTALVQARNPSSGAGQAFRELRYSVQVK